MGRSRYKIFDEAQPHFLTMTIVHWLPLLSNPEIANIILESLRFLHKERRVTFYAYVILENHLHLIASSEQLSKDIKDFKSFTARQIIDFLEDRKAFNILKQLRIAKLRHKKESDYQVWQEGSHPEQIISEKVLLQKIEYIHYNPVKRGYVDKPKHWRYSSARNYEGMEGLIEVTTDW